MIRNLLRMTALFLPLFLPLYAEAREEIYTNSFGLSLGGGSSQISFAPGYNHQFFEWLQAGIGLNYQKLAFAKATVNTYTLQVGPTINIGPVENAIFFSVGYAIRKGSGKVPAGETDPAGGGPYLSGGRRFNFGNISYRPNIGVQSAGGTTFFFNFLALSYFL